MGTNYYAIKKVNLQDRIKMLDAISKDEFGKLKELIPQEIHIGKSSMGWQFIFDHSDWKYFDKSKNSINEFLLKCTIMDEYGEEIALDSFWEMVDKRVSLNLIYNTEQ